MRRSNETEINSYTSHKIRFSLQNDSFLIFLYASHIWSLPFGISRISKSLYKLTYYFFT
jgi:hypothetical protein